MSIPLTLRKLGYSKASVCVAVKKLRQENLAEMESDKKIHLTVLDEKTAADLEKKYTRLKRLLISVNVDEQTASQDACRMEHVISSESLNRLEIELVRDSQLKKACIDK
jgi:Mn-dependent DtxR family transcriptional regulator